MLALTVRDWLHIMEWRGRQWRGRRTIPKHRGGWCANTRVPCPCDVRDLDKDFGHKVDPATEQVLLLSSAAVDTSQQV